MWRLLKEVIFFFLSAHICSGQTFTDNGVLFGEKSGRVGWIDFVVLLMNGELE
jgi:hypothetical protein